MNYLKTIVEHKYEEVSKRKSSFRRSSLESLEHFQRSPVSLVGALGGKQPFAVIAEIKRSSPSAGILNSKVHPPSLAKEYESHGAAAISVLTDERFFSGSITDLQEVRGAVQVPLLRKEFIVDEYQISEAKAYGADAVLLIAAILAPSQLRELFFAASELKLECLVELYDAAEIDKLDLDRMKLIGINNRDLRTFTIDLNQTLRIAQNLPAGATVVSESGITSAEDLKRLMKHNIHAALIGEFLVKSERPGVALQRLLEGLDT